MMSSAKPETLWREYGPKLTTFVKRRVAEPSAAEDILQDIFIKIQTGLPRLKEDAKLQAWLFRIARHALIDYYRSVRPLQPLPEGLEAEPPDEREKARQDLAECLPPMIQDLPPRYREALMLSEIQGMTQKALAEVQGLSLSGAKSRVQRGRALLKSMLMDCCRLEIGTGGRILDYEKKDRACHRC